MEESNGFLLKILSKVKMALVFKVLLAVFLLCAILGLVLFFKKRPVQEQVVDLELKSVKIEASELIIPDEPLPLPPIQFSREQKQVWSEEDVQSFYIEPEESTMELLHKKNEEKILKFLEGVE